MIPFVVRRSRWVILGWVARRVGRAGVKTSIDKATENLEQRIPAPVAKAIDRLPGDLARAGGMAVVVGNGARSTTVAAAKVASSGKRIVGSGRRTPAAVSSRIHNVRDDIAIESERARRRITADMLRETSGEAAALEALIDMRPVEQDSDPVNSAQSNTAQPTGAQTSKRRIPSIGPGIARGRRRHIPALPARPVGRVSRTYKKRRKAWDRPVRRRD